MGFDPKNSFRQASNNQAKNIANGGNNGVKQLIVMQVEGVLDIDGRQYLQGIRISENKTNGTKVCVCVPDSVQEIKQGDFNALMSPRNKNQVKEGGIVAFRDCGYIAKQTVKGDASTNSVDQEYMTYESEYYDVVQHASQKENVEFMRDFANKEPGDGFSLGLQGTGYNRFWTQNGPDGSTLAKGRSVIFRTDDAEMRSISSIEELKGFLVESIEGYKPKGLHANEMRRIRFISGDEAYDTGVEIYSSYSPDAFEVNGKVIGGYTLPREALDKRIDNFLRQGSTYSVLQVAKEVFDSGASVDVELLPGKSFSWGSKSLLGGNSVFNSDGTAKPVKEGGKWAPITIENKRYERNVPVQNEAGETEWFPKQAVSTVQVGIKCLKGDEGEQKIFATSCVKNHAPNHAVEIARIETPNFTPPKKEQSANTANNADNSSKAQNASSNMPESSPQSQSASKQATIPNQQSNANQSAPPANKPNASSQRPIDNEPAPSGLEDAEGDLDAFFDSMDDGPMGMTR